MKGALKFSTRLRQSFLKQLAYGLLALLLPPPVLALVFLFAPPPAFELFMLFALPLLALPPLMLALLPMLALFMLFALPVVLVVLVVPVVPVVPVVVVIVVFVVVVLALPVPVFVLSVVVQPAQKTATASKAKRAKVLCIEFSPVTQWVNVLGVVRPFPQTRFGASASTQSKFEPSRQRSLLSISPEGREQARGVLTVHYQ
jgi:hypothetical protein